MFPGTRVGGEPDGSQGRHHSQIFYVPVRPHRQSQMMAAAGSQAAAAEGAADIRIPALPEFENTEPPHLQPAGVRAIEDEGIGA